MTGLDIDGGVLLCPFQGHTLAGHQPIMPGGRPWGSISRQYSHRSTAIWRIPCIIRSQPMRIQGRRDRARLHSRAESSELHILGELHKGIGGFLRSQGSE